MKSVHFERRVALLGVAKLAAREAAATLMRGWRTRVAVEHKSRVDLVTEYDRASERLLRERLSATGVAFVGEEEGGHRAGGHEATWFVDPIDGTTNFVHGHPYFCVSIGLVVGDRPVAGVVNAPGLGIEWAAAIDDDGGALNQTFATRNDVPIRVSATEALIDSLLATGFPYDVATSRDNNLDAFCHVIQRARAIRRCGAAALDLCHVAEGTFDGYWERKLKPWDLAAGAAIVEAAGGRVTADHGGPIDFATGHIVATNHVIHDLLINELARAEERYDG